MATLKELSGRPTLLTGGHRLCAGCAEPVAVRQILGALKGHAVIGCATGCLEVGTTIYPYTAWRTSYIHNAFENVAATVSGVETAYRALRKKGKIKDDGRVKFLAIAGDGGTYDIGFQSLSGAMERGHNMVCVCLDNEAYMNTGIQRSGATPKWADTTTSPAGKAVPGKTMHRKDLTAIMAAHGIPYVAQASPSYWSDLVKKAEKALAVEGPAFLNILAPCPRGWRFEPEESIAIGRLAVETCYWPLFEVEDGETRLTYRPKQKRPLRDYLEPQGRFKHLFRPGREPLLDELQAYVDARWERLLRQCGAA